MYLMLLDVRAMLDFVKNGNGFLPEGVFLDIVLRFNLQGRELAYLNDIIFTDYIRKFYTEKGVEQFIKMFGR